jgi:hypothetical protein
MSPLARSCRVPPEKSPRSHPRLVASAALFALCVGATGVCATDLRGRVEAKPARTVTVELRLPKPPHDAVRKAVADREGRYYLADVPPGRYDLVVNGVKFPISVEQVAIQEVPPIQL